MNTNEVIAELSRLLPKHSICATKELWKHDLDESPSKPSYHISVLPGSNGMPCQRFDGSTFEDALERARLAYFPDLKPSTENKE